MEVQYEVIKECPVVMIDDLFTEEQLAECWATVDSFRIKDLMPPLQTQSAEDEEGRPLKQNRGFFLNHLYQGHPQLNRFNNVFREVYAEVCKETQKLHPAFDVTRTYEPNDRLDYLLSYYGNSDHYLPHRDASTVTNLVWLARDESKFEGGNLLIQNEYKIEFKHNRMVLFPGYTLHQVGPVTMDEKDAEAGLGRYVFSVFHSYQDEGMPNPIA